MAEEKIIIAFFQDQFQISIVGLQLAFFERFNSPCLRAFFPASVIRQKVRSFLPHFRRYAISQARLEITHRLILLDNNLLPNEANPNKWA